MLSCIEKCLHTSPDLLHLFQNASCPMSLFSRIFLLMATAAGCTIFLSCTAVTPEWRINQNASLYESLSESHRALASQGRIAKGMPQSAVYFALGTPTQKVRGHRSGTPFERWDYFRRQPHLHHSFCLLYTSPSPRDRTRSRMPSSA